MNSKLINPVNGGISHPSSLIPHPSSGEVSEGERQRARLKKATQDFEAVFVGIMLKQMRKTMQSDNPLFGKSSQSQRYMEMMDDAVAQQISRTGKFGFGDLLYKKVERTLLPDPATLSSSASKLDP